MMVSTMQKVTLVVFNAKASMPISKKWLKFRELPQNYKHAEAPKLKSEFDFKSQLNVQ